MLHKPFTSFQSARSVWFKLRSLDSTYHNQILGKREKDRGMIYHTLSEFATPRKQNSCTPYFR